MAALNSLTLRVRLALLGSALLATLAAGFAVSGLAATLSASTAAGAVSAQNDAQWSPAFSTADPAGAYEPHQLLVGLTHGASATAAAAYVSKLTSAQVQVSAKTSGDPDEALLQLPANVTVTSAVAAIKAAPTQAKPGAAATSAPISSANPDYIAVAAGSETIPTPTRWIPNDRGDSSDLGGWQQLQWNFDPRAGVDAPGAWANLRADDRPGASGVTIAVVDSGVAFQNWHQFKRSPDFGKTKFVDPCDLVNGNVLAGQCTNPHADDRTDHGTFVAGEIAESTNNYRGVTGLAYGASIMPVRVLDSQDAGSEAAVAAGIRYAVNHGAQIINLSLEFSGVTRSEVPDVITALAYAQDKHVIVVGVAGNDSTGSLDYPAADKSVISVAATTYDLCLASYSNWGSGLELVAPGGGYDAKLNQSDCHPNRGLPSIYQTTFANPSKPGDFSLPKGWYGTSMAAPEVSAAAAMVIASGVIGTAPTSKQVLDRLEATARPLGGKAPNKHYGYGLIDIDKATTAGGPTTPG